MKPSLTMDGYPQTVIISDKAKNGYRQSMKIHRLIAIAFVDNPNGYKEVFNVGLLYYVVQRNMYQLSSKKLLTKNTMNSLYVKNEIETITDPKMVLARILKKRNIATEQNTTNKCLTLKTMDDNTNIFSIKF